MMAEQGEVIAVLLSAVGTRQGSSPCQPTAIVLEIRMTQVKSKRLSEEIDRVRDSVIAPNDPEALMLTLPGNNRSRNQTKLERPRIYPRETRTN